MLERALAEVERTAEQAQPLRDAVTGLRDARRPAQARLHAGTDPVVRPELARPSAARLRQSQPAYPLLVERERALYGAWYEIFPRSEGADPRPGDRAVDERHPAHRGRSGCRPSPDMGFDVVYLTPVHPIGTDRRKGPNNTLDAGARRPRLALRHRLARRRPRRHPPRPRHLRRLRPLRRRGGAARARGRPRPRAAGVARPPLGRRRTPSGSPPARTARSPTPRTRRRSTRTSTR